MSALIFALWYRSFFSEIMEENNTCVMKITNDDLPKKFLSKIATDTKYETIVRSQLLTLEDIQEWVTSFGKLTNTAWIVKKARSEAESYICRKVFLCHHSTLRKSSLSEKRTKNYDCKASIVAKVKISNTDSRHVDPYMRQGLCCVITIDKTHSHTLSDKYSLRALQTDEKIKIRFHRYFDYGMGVTESSRYHKRHLELQGYSALDFLNGRLNPSKRRLQYWHDERKKKNPDSNDRLGYLDLLKQRLATFVQKGFTILLHENPFAAAIVTPLMKRTHALKSSQNLVLVDSVSACDKDGHCVTFMFTPCPAGASPLAVIITNDQSYKSFVAGFKMIKIAVEKGFGGQGFPRIFLTDNLPDEITALQTIWPESKNMLCGLSLYQDVWRELWKAEDISKESKLDFMRLFQTMLYGKNSDEVAAVFRNLLQDSEPYPKFQDYMSRYWDLKELCCQFWHDKIYSDSHPHDFLEISVKIFKEFELSRVKAYNTLALIDFCCEELENYHCYKFLQFLSSKNAFARLFLKSFYENISCLDPEDVICSNADEFLLPCEDEGELFVINVKSALCSCPEGQDGKFCNHLCALYKCFDIPENVSPITADDRYEIATLMYGEDLPVISYHEPLPMEIDRKHFISE